METLSGFRVALFAALVVGGAWASYWPRIRAHRVPRKPRVWQALMIAGVAMAVASFTMEPGVGGALLGVAAIGGAAFFLGSSLMSGLPQATPAVAIGDRYMDFSTRDSQGNDFRLSSLEGGPFILKFYRGHW